MTGRYSPNNRATRGDSSADARTLLVIVLLVVSVVVAYWKVTNNEFVNYDDNDYVTENRQVQAGLTLDGIIWAFTTGHTANWHPLTWLSHMLDCELFGLNPWGHHLTSLLLHILNSVLLFLLLKQMTNEIWQSAFVAALFGLHPLHVESVAWVAERKDVLSTLFLIITIWAYLLFVKRPGLKRYLLVALSLTLGLMTKPMLVTLPLILLLLDFWPLGRLQGNTSPWLPFEFLQTRALSGTRTDKFSRVDNLRSRLFSLILEKVPLLLIAGVSSAITIIVQGQIGAISALENLPLSARLSNALVAYVEYIRKMIWPSGLAVFYPHLGGSLTLWQVLGAALFLALTSALVIRGIKRSPYFMVGWFWYLGTLVPVIGLVQIGSQGMADRYTYITLIGLSIVVAWGIPELMSTWKRRKVTLVLAAGTALFASMILTRSQVGYWRDSITLFEHAIKVTSNNWVAHINLASALKQQHREEEAITHFIEAVKIMPNSEDAHYNLGVALFEQGRIRESIPHYLRALQLRPENWKAHYNVGLAFSHEDLLNDAITHYSEALRLKPDYPEAHFYLGVTYHTGGQLKKAIAHYSEAVRLKPDYAIAHSNLGTALHSQGNINQAIAHYSEALRLKPDLLEARNNLEIALADQQKRSKP